MNTSVNTKSKVTAKIEKLGIGFSAVFVPFSRSRNAGEKHKSLNWLVTINSGSSSITTDYMQGIGHIPWKTKSPARLNPRSIDAEAAINSACESGHYTLGYAEWRQAKIPTPALLDILACLCSDASVLDCATFEDWAANCGYETDSRKAESIYNDCLEIALKLRSMLGAKELASLQELLSDY